MAAAATPPTTLCVPGVCSSASILRPKTTFTPFTNPDIFLKASVKTRIGLVRATNPRNKETPNSNSTTAADAFISQEDVSYLIKVGAGSLVGAAAIKYGSIVFPEITTPNILQALTMIFAPVILAVLLLIKQSSAAD